MEVQGKNGETQASKQRLVQAHRDYLAAQVSRARAVRDEAQPAERADRVELSAAAEAHHVDAERSRRVEELRTAHETGQLNTPERIERAATRLLEG